MKPACSTLDSPSPPTPTHPKEKAVERHTQVPFPLLCHPMKDGLSQRLRGQASVTTGIARQHHKGARLQLSDTFIRSHRFWGLDLGISL